MDLNNQGVVINVNNRSVFPPNPDGAVVPPINADNVDTMPLNAGSGAAVPLDAGISDAMALNSDDSSIPVTLHNENIKASSESADLNNETESKTMDISFEPEKESVYKSTPSNHIAAVVIKNNAKPSNSTVDETENGEKFYIIPADISRTPDEGPTQPKLDAYPKTRLSNTRFRSFCANWYNRFPWLEYSVSFDRVYCFACRHYGNSLFKPSPLDIPGKKHPLKKGATIYATTGFCRWAKAHERMQRHNSSARHLEAMGPWLEDTLNREKQGVSSNGEVLRALTQSPAKNVPPKSEDALSPLPSKRKRSRPTKKLARSDEDDYEITHNCPSWCSCTKCIEMSKMHECVCCGDVPEIRAKVDTFDANMICITDHPGFASICLNEWAIQVSYYQYREENGTPSVKEEHERFRYIAYCQFVRWCWGYFREDMHIPLPSCVVNSIKATFHSQASLPALDDLPASTNILKH